MDGSWTRVVNVTMFVCHFVDPDLGVEKERAMEWICLLLFFRNKKEELLKALLAWAFMPWKVGSVDLSSYYSEST